MNELRSFGGHLRALFCFDPERNAIVLLGGDKRDDWAGWRRGPTHSWEVLTVTDAIRWVGLDVHVTQTTVAVIDKASGELRRAKLRGSPSTVLDFIAGLTAG